MDKKANKNEWYYDPDDDRILKTISDPYKTKNGSLRIRIWVFNLNDGAKFHNMLLPNFPSTSNYKKVETFNSSTEKVFQ